MCDTRRHRTERSQSRIPRGARRRRILHRPSPPAGERSGLMAPRLDPVPLAADTGAMSENEAALVPEQGWHCLHLFYRIEFSQWQLLSPDEQRAAKTALTSLVQEVRAMESTQLLTLSVVTPKADLGFMLITPDLHDANKIEKRISLSLGPDVLAPVYSYLSLTEESEYTTSEEEYAAILVSDQKIE